MLFFIIKHCQIFILTKGHGAGVTEGTCMHIEMFIFLRFDPAFFLLSLSLFHSLFFYIFLRISYARPFESPLIGVNWAALRRYNGKPNICGSKIWPFVFLLRKPFAPFPYMLESSCSYYFYSAYYRIEWYQNWKIACINLAVRVVQKVLDSNYA